MKTKIFKRRIALLSLAFVYSVWIVEVYAQDKPLKWGDIPAEDLQMTAYEADTNAVAVVLGELGEIKVEKSGQLIYDYHLRVKLLSEAAYDKWGTYRLPYNTGQLDERIRDVEGITHVLDPAGKPVKHKMDKKSIFKEKLSGNYDQLRFTLPALAPGAVVEFRYRMITDSPVFLPDWTFQHDEPTRFSELRAEISNYFVHARISTVQNYDIEEQVDIPTPGDETTKFRWVMKDVPALREEPFVTTIEDYRLKLAFQLASYFDPNVGPTTFMKNWDQLASEIRDIGNFGRAFIPPKNVSQLAQELVAGKTSPRDKMIAIYRYVRSNHLWNGEYGFIPDRSLGDILKTERASSPEQAILMVALMRSVGVDANPVLISTRQHGRVLKSYPVFSQFNYLITHVDTGDGEYLLDATEENGPYTMLAERALNNAGWLVTEDKNKWIPVSSSDKYIQLTSLEGKLTEEGAAAFALSSSNAGYRALELRNALQNVDEKTFFQDYILEKQGEFGVKDVVISNTDSLLKPLTVDAALYIENFGAPAGEFMYFSPQVISAWEENPLRLPERTFPVDFSYPRDYVYNLRLELPEGYVVHEQPKDINLRLPKKSGSFLRTFSVAGNTLVVQSRFTLVNATYSPEMYHNLREMYDRVVAAQADQVVLKKLQGQ